MATLVLVWSRHFRFCTEWKPKAGWLQTAICLKLAPFGVESETWKRLWQWYSVSEANLAVQQKVFHAYWQWKFGFICNICWSSHGYLSACSRPTYSRLQFTCWTLRPSFQNNAHAKISISFLVGIGASLKSISQPMTHVCHCLPSKGNPSYIIVSSSPKDHVNSSVTPSDSFGWRSSHPIHWSMIFWRKLPVLVYWCPRVRKFGIVSFPAGSLPHSIGIIDCKRNKHCTLYPRKHMIWLKKKYFD